MSPFNTAKYEALLKGLEISEIKFTKLNTFETFRCDAEYFQKQYIIDEALTSKRAKDFCKFKSYNMWRRT